MDFWALRFGVSCFSMLDCSFANVRLRLFLAPQTVHGVYAALRVAAGGTAEDFGVQLLRQHACMWKPSASAHARLPVCSPVSVDRHLKTESAVRVVIQFLCAPAPRAPQPSALPHNFLEYFAMIVLHQLQEEMVCVVS